MMSLSPKPPRFHVYIGNDLIALFFVEREGNNDPKRKRVKIWNIKVPEPIEGYQHV